MMDARSFLLAAAPADADGLASVIREPVGTLTHWGDRLADLAISRGPSIVVALVFLVVAWVVSSSLRALVVRGLTRAHLDLTLSKFFGNLARWALLALAVIACLDTFGISTTSFAAVIGAAGLAIGLALQGNLSNLAAGVMLLIFRPFKIGDAVVIAGRAGIVDGIDLFTTNLDTEDNRRIIVPNGAVVGGVIENQTRHATRCVLLSVPVSAGVDVAPARAQLRAAVDRVALSAPGALREPAPGVALNEAWPVLLFGVTLWARTEAYAAVREALLCELKAALDQGALSPGAAVQDVRVVAQAPPSVPTSP